MCSADPKAPVHPDLAGYYEAAQKGNALPDEEEEKPQQENAPEGAAPDAAPSAPGTPAADSPENEDTAPFEETPGSSPEKLSGPSTPFTPAEEAHAAAPQPADDADNAGEPGLVAALAGEAHTPEDQDATHTGDDGNTPEDGDDDSEKEEKEDETEADRPMTLKDHFLELRKRLTLIFFCTILGFIACYPFSQQIFEILVVPLKAAMPENSSFVFTAPGEGFFTNLKVAFVAGVFLASPLIFYQIWAFIAPGLYETEKRHILPVAFFSALFFMSGGLFCYFVAFPFAFDFFMAYATGDVKAMLSLSETLSFILQLLLAFGIIFELPLFVFFLARLGLITADWMRSMRRYAVLVNVVVAAILTPPDVMSQMLMAAPLLLLYEISILVAATFGRKKKEEPAEATDKETTEETDEPAS